MGIQERWLTVVLAAALTPFAGEKVLTYCGLGMRLYTRSVPDLAKYTVLRRLVERTEIGHVEMYAGLDEEECIAYARLPYIVALDEWVIDPGEHNMLYTVFFEIEYPTQRLVLERYASEVAEVSGIPIDTIREIVDSMDEYCCDAALLTPRSYAELRGAVDRLAKAIERVELRHARLLSISFCEVIVGRGEACHTLSLDDVNRLASANPFVSDLTTVLGLGGGRG